VPGYLPLGMGARAEEAMKQALKETPLGRLGTAEDVAEIVKSIARMNSVSGQVFVVDTRLP
ncbi:MAG: beta-ketoacyl-ACP reductase, partial [Nitrospirae bacterium]